MTRPLTTTNVIVEREAAATTIFIVSSHCLFREAIEQLIKSPGFTIVGKDMDFAEMLQETSIGTRPNLVISILDPDQEAVAGLEVLKGLHSRLGNTKTMILIPFEQQVSLLAAVQSGVDAILTTKASGAVLRCPSSHLSRPACAAARGRFPG